MAARVPTHVPVSWGPSVTVGVLVFMYHACSLHLKTLALLSLDIFRGYLLVLDPKYYTHHVHFLADYALHIYGFQHTHYWGPLAWPINSTRPPSWPAPHRCQCPITWAPSPALWSSTKILNVFLLYILLMIFLILKYNKNINIKYIKKKIM